MAIILHGKRGIVALMSAGEMPFVVLRDAPDPQPARDDSRIDEAAENAQIAFPCFECADEDTLLDAIRSVPWPIGSSCGGRGACDACKIQTFTHRFEGGPPESSERLACSETMRRFRNEVLEIRCPTWGRPLTSIRVSR